MISLKRHGFLMLLLIVSLSIVAYIRLATKVMPDNKEFSFMNGVSFVATRDEIPANPFQTIIDINANWVAIMPYAFVNGNSPDLRYNQSRQWWGERADGVASTIVHAKQSGLNVLLKPHVWVQGQGWTGDFKLDSDKEWEKWENDYSDYILSFARLADSLQVEAFCVGLEFKNVVVERPEYFGALIDQVRKVYGGLVTYAANWDNYQNVTFWDKVDFIGVNAYFPLSQEDTPSVEVLQAAWGLEKEKLKKLCEKHQKSMVFTEYGYRSINKSAGNQWELTHHRKYDGTPNFTAQENSYLALFKTFWHEPWIKGGFLWKWYSNEEKSMTGHDSDYTPQFKPVEKTIQEWYKKR